jgi:bacterioferritin
MSEAIYDKAAVIAALNRIMELELAGVVRYTQHSLMVYGYSRMPIISWLRDQSTESLMHATEAGEMITQLEAEPSLKIGGLLEKHTYDIGDILRESLEHEGKALQAYEDLLALVDGKSVLIEEYARRLIGQEAAHKGEVAKMLRAPAGAGH